MPFLKKKLLTRRFGPSLSVYTCGELDRFSDVAPFHTSWDKASVVVMNRLKEILTFSIYIGLYL